jgi:hypothetical protein
MRGRAAKRICGPQGKMKLGPLLVFTNDCIIKELQINVKRIPKGRSKKDNPEKLVT